MDVLQRNGITRWRGERQRPQLCQRRFEQILFDTLFEENSITTTDIAADVQLLHVRKQRKVFQKNAEIIGFPDDNRQRLQTRKRLLANRQFLQHRTIESKILNNGSVNMKGTEQ